MNKLLYLVTLQIFYFVTTNLIENPSKYTKEKGRLPSLANHLVRWSQMEMKVKIQTQIEMMLRHWLEA